MTRAERRRVERLRRTVLTAGLGFALGALVDTALTWRMHEFDSSPAARTESAAPSPGPGPSEPVPADRPAAHASLPAVGTRGIAGHEEAVATLRKRRLEVPVEGISRTDLIDTFFDARTGRAHEAMDIMAPRHTPVRAVDDGTIAKLFTSKAGGLTIYQFEPSGTFCYYYAHLDRYAPGLHEGQSIGRGETIGYVGSTGNASETAPHLHFAIFRLNEARQWWKGDPINPFAVLR